MAAHRIVFFVYPGFQSLDLNGPYEVFAGVNATLRRPAYELSIVAMQAGPVTSESGLQIIAGRSADSVDADAVDTIVVVGGNGVMPARHDPSTVAAVARLSQSAGRVASVCSGTFLLAEAGLLDGVRVTTHWYRADQLAAEHPAVTVDADPIHIRSGRIWTSAGVTAGIDLALAMVEDEHGAEVAQSIARMLVMFLRRPGGQSQFATAVWSGAVEHQPIRSALDLVHRDPAADLSVPRLAEAALMSERHFLRVFAREVGCTPAVYVERVRVEAARRMLETQGVGLDAIAVRSGFGSTETMRRAFVRRLGVPPSAYRDRFASGSAAQDGPTLRPLTDQALTDQTGATR